MAPRTCAPARRSLQRLTVLYQHIHSTPPAQMGSCRVPYNLPYLPSCAAMAPFFCFLSWLKALVAKRGSRQAIKDACTASETGRRKSLCSLRSWTKAWWRLAFCTWLGVEATSRRTSCAMAEFCSSLILRNDFRRSSTRAYPWNSTNMPGTTLRDYCVVHGQQAMDSLSSSQRHVAKILCKSYLLTFRSDSRIRKGSQWSRLR